MPFRSDDEALEKIRASVDIREIISGYLPLKKVGGRYRGLCPFHTEKTPSLHVDPGKQLFYCFGCGTGGDAFKFLMLYEKVDFPEALRMLSRRYGIPLPERVHHASSERQALTQVNQAAADFFAGALADATGGKGARDYLKERGLSAATVSSFHLGFAPARWDGLKSALMRRGISETQLLAAGLLSKKEETGRTFDRFRGRLMFPIRTLSGGCVGFGGRILGPGEPKYLNSPETLLFHKGEILYGMDRTSEAIRKADRAILVEGYMDFLTLHQAGIENLVATLGTGFTAGHVRLLARATRRVVVNFDPDSAGQAATRRSLDVLLESGFEVRVLRLPAGKDPDRFVREDGPERYLDLAAQAPTYVEYLAREAAQRVDLTGPAGKIQALNEVLPFVARIENAVERSEQVKLLSEMFRIQDGIVLQELKAAVQARRTNLKSPAASPTPEALRSPAARLLKLFVEVPESRRTVVSALSADDLTGSGVERLWKAALDASLREEITYPRLGSMLSDPVDQDLLLRLGALPGPEPGPSETEDCLKRLKSARLARRLQEVQERLERAADGASVDDLLRQKMDLRREIHALRSATAP